MPTGSWRFSGSSGAGGIGRFVTAILRFCCTVICSALLATWIQVHRSDVIARAQTLFPKNTLSRWMPFKIPGNHDRIQKMYGLIQSNHPYEISRWPTSSDDIQLLGRMVRLSRGSHPSLWQEATKDDVRLREDDFGSHPMFFANALEMVEEAAHDTSQAPPGPGARRVGDLEEQYRKHLEETFAILRTQQAVQMIKCKVPGSILHFQRQTASADEAPVNLRGRVPQIPVVAVSRTTRNFLNQTLIIYVDPLSLPAKVLNSLELPFRRTLVSKYLLVPDLSGKNVTLYSFQRR